jgi:aminopeptidase
MADARVKELARILVNYSTQIKKWDNVLISTDGFESLPLLKEVYKLVVQREAFPFVRISFPGMKRAFYKHASEEMLKHLPEVDLFEVKRMNAYIRIGSADNTQELAGINPARMDAHHKTYEPVQNHRIENTNWVTTQYPTSAYAQRAGMSTEEFENFVYSATNINWQEQTKFQDRVKRMFDNAKQVRLLSNDTDLKFSLAGRFGTKCDGIRNMPDGEVYYAPTENSANGFITFTYPAIRHGMEVEKVRLEFKNGKVVKASAETNEDVLKSALTVDDDARLIGEFGIGTNYGIKRFTKNLLFDEKIGGTIHLALGRAYKGSGGTSRSAIHWDMVKDFRTGGEIIMDGKTVQKNGKFVFKG